MGGHLVHHGLPGSLRHFRVVRGEISTGKIKVKRWLSVRFRSLRLASFGFAFVSCAKRSLLFRAVILAAKNAVTPAVQSVFGLHVFLHVEENERAEFFPLASSGGVATELVRIVHSAFVLLANLLAFLVFPVLPAGEIARRERFKIWLQR